MLTEEPAQLTALCSPREGQKLTALAHLGGDRWGAGSHHLPTAEKGRSYSSELGRDPVGTGSLRVARDVPRKVHFPTIISSYSLFPRDESHVRAGEVGKGQKKYLRRRRMTCMKESPCCLPTRASDGLRVFQNWLVAAMTDFR